MPNFFRSNFFRPNAIGPIVWLAFFLTGCSFPLSGTPFKILGEYQALRSGYIIRAYGEGVVDFGADVNSQPNGLTHLCPVKSGAQKPIQLAWKNTDAIHYQIVGGASGTEPLKTGKTERELVSRLLAQAGYMTVDPKEVEETIKVIYGVMSGPKAATLEGQSSYLKVLSVSNSDALESTKSSNQPLDPVELTRCN